MNGTIEDDREDIKKIVDKHLETNLAGFDKEKYLGVAVYYNKGTIEATMMYKKEYRNTINISEIQIKPAQIVAGYISSLSGNLSKWQNIEIDNSIESENPKKEVYINLGGTKKIKLYITGKQWKSKHVVHAEVIREFRSNPHNDLFGTIGVQHKEILPFDNNYDPYRKINLSESTNNVKFKTSETGSWELIELKAQTNNGFKILDFSNQTNATWIKLGIEEEKNTRSTWEVGTRRRLASTNTWAPGGHQGARDQYDRVIGGDIFFENKDVDEKTSYRIWFNVD
jgi:hypothetical protein